MSYPMRQTAKSAIESSASARRFKVVIDLHRLRTTLMSADGCFYSTEDIQQWLIDAGFTPSGEAWIVDEANLGQIEPSEVLSITPLN